MTGAGQAAMDGSPAKPRFPPQDEAFLQRWRSSLGEHKTKVQLAKLLAKTLIFADTSEAFRLAIVENIKAVQYHEGQVVFRQAEMGDWLAIVLTGRLERKLQRSNRYISIGDIGPGGIVGDIGLFGISATRSFSVVALANSLLLILSKDDFNQAVCVAGGPASLSLFRDGSQMMNLLADTESFLELKCFKKLDRDFVMTLQENSEPMLCYPNQCLMKENAYGNEMYILRAGSVKIEKNKKVIVELGAGVVLGELAVLGSDKRRKATVTCTSLCLIRMLHGDVFHDILNQFPRAKRVFDHAYIARLVSIEMASAGEELRKLDQFYGSATPRTDAQMVQMFGATRELDDKKQLLDEATGTHRSNFSLPKIQSPRGKATHCMLGGTDELDLVSPLNPL
jgi:CRP-like cAMP-binding protein